MMYMCRSLLPRLHIQTGLVLLPAKFFSILNEDEKFNASKNPKPKNKKLKLPPYSPINCCPYICPYIRNFHLLHAQNKRGKAICRLKRKK